MERTVLLTDSFGLLLWSVPFLLYAETHYRFRYFLSFLFKREPEVIADAPFRIEPGHKLPILLIAKDAHKFPSTLRSARVQVRQDGKLIHEKVLIQRSIHLTKKWWWRIFVLNPRGWSGWVDLDVTFRLESNHGDAIYANDNYRTSSHKPLRVFISRHRFPKRKGLHYGDIHTHSNYTDDQVEFGAPLPASKFLAQAIGLSFFAATDHSYDLDDEIDDYLRNDPRVPKWRAQQAEIDSLNQRQRKFAVLRGEEVSCRNSSGRNVHFLMLGNKTFLPGSGDSAERWFRTKSELRVDQILRGRRDGALCLAAHPVESIPILQKILIGRGSWSDDDINSGGLTGIQFLNGFAGEGSSKGLEQWKRALLRGLRLITVAGNDAHGNFNRFRQIGFPFLSIYETQYQIFGGMRTAVFVNGLVTEKKILNAVQRGKCAITDGPIAWFDVRCKKGKRSAIGGRVPAERVAVAIGAVSSPEFGKLEEVILWLGIVGEERERVVFRQSGMGKNSYWKRLVLFVRTLSYLRLEVKTSFRNEYDQRPHFCITNPLWLYEE